MQNLHGKTAVITGAGSGFGRELAILGASLGMNLALADVDAAGMDETVGLLPDGARAFCQVTDVRQPEALEALTERTWAEFGGCALLINNAGVAVAGPTWTTTLDEWRWVLDVNLMGVVHGIRSFVPRMLESGEPGHIVNTASVAGLLSVPGSSIYCVSKHGVVTLSETLHHELRMMQKNIGVSVLCPAFVPTGIADSRRHQPAELAEANPLGAPFEAMAKQAVAKGKISATEVARQVFDAVQADQFYIITHDNIRPAVETRFADLRENRAPTNTATPGARA